MRSSSMRSCTSGARRPPSNTGRRSSSTTASRPEPPWWQRSGGLVPGARRGSSSRSRSVPSRASSCCEARQTTSSARTRSTGSVPSASGMTPSRKSRTTRWWGCSTSWGGRQPPADASGRARPSGSTQALRARQRSLQLGRYLATLIVPLSNRPRGTARTQGSETRRQEALGGGEHDECDRVVGGDAIGVDDDVVVRRELGLFAVEPPEIIGAARVGVVHPAGCVLLAQLLLLSDAAAARFPRGGDEHAE